ncbi:MAG: MFS transporter, partial [Chloroflexi bacterium]|nr:MFS transporter [Chloroflexota bacterium]
DFRLIVSGQLISAIGDQMQSVGIAWHIYVLTGSALQLGLTGLFRAVPFLALSLLGGAMADAMDRKQLLLITQATRMIITFGLVIAAATGHVTLWLLYGVTALSGAATAFDNPVRQAIIPNLVPRRDLTGALTLMSLTRQTATIVGPSVGGIVIARFGLSADYLGNAISFLAVVIAVLLLGPLPKTRRLSTRTWDTVLGGLRFARQEPLIMLPLLLDFTTRVAISSRALFPIYASVIFHVGPQGLGWLNSSVALGAVAGGLALGSRRSVRYPIALMVAAYATEGVFMAAFGLSGTLVLGVATQFLVGIANVTGEVLQQTVMQLKTRDEVRGRVTALAGMFTSGGPMLGQLESGLVANYIGVIGSTVTGGLGSVAIALCFALTPGLRQRLGESAEKLAAEAA